MPRTSRLRIQSKTAMRFGHFFGSLMGTIAERDVSRGFARIIRVEKQTINRWCVKMSCFSRFFFDKQDTHAGIAVKFPIVVMLCVKVLATRGSKSWCDATILPPQLIQETFRRIYEKSTVAENSDSIKSWTTNNFLKKENQCETKMIAHKSQNSCLLFLCTLL